MIPAWLVAMPALKLAEDVPLITRNGADQGVAFDVSPSGDAARVYSREHEAAWTVGVNPVNPQRAARVDLGRPMGFLYALTLWATFVDACFYTSDATGARRAYGITHSAKVRDLWDRHIRGTVTDDDRLELAQRLAEMAEG